jgi:hypothetical protein
LFEQPLRPLPVSELGFRTFLAELSGVPIRRTGQVSPLFPRDMAQQKEWDIKACHSVVFGVNGTPEGNPHPAKDFFVLFPFSKPLYK